jgi:hypothetical protein
MQRLICFVGLCRSLLILENWNVLSGFFVIYVSPAIPVFSGQADA